MVFRRDSKVDAFQRQISALRHQLGGEHENVAVQDYESLPALHDDHRYRNDIHETRVPERERSLAPPDYAEHVGLGESVALAQAVPAIDTQTSVIAHSTAWNGNLESTGSLHVHGRVEGSLTARDDIFVAEEADVDAIISAANVTIAGNVRGSISCAERFEVLPRGRVAGDVRAPVVVIHDGALIAGEIAMSPSHESRTTLPAASVARAARGGD